MLYDSRYDKMMDVGRNSKFLTTFHYGLHKIEKNELMLLLYFTALM